MYILQTYNGLYTVWILMHISLNISKFNSSASLICEALKKGLAAASYIEHECIHMMYQIWMRKFRRKKITNNIFGLEHEDCW